MYTLRQGWKEAGASPLVFLAYLKLASSYAKNADSECVRYCLRQSGPRYQESIDEWMIPVPVSYEGHPDIGSMTRLDVQEKN